LIEILNYVLSDFWRFAGFAFLLSIATGGLFRFLAMIGHGFHRLF
jgi:hypothetical protein